MSNVIYMYIIIKPAIIKQSDKTTMSPYQSKFQRADWAKEKIKWWSMYTYAIAKYAIVLLLHFWVGQIQGQKKLFVTSTYNQTHSYYIECSRQHPPLSTMDGGAGRWWKFELYIILHHHISQ